jgi:predicted  nucleic acid-binding Zn-ribbon protein
MTYEEAYNTPKWPNDMECDHCGNNEIKCFGIERNEIEFGCPECGYKWFEMIEDEYDNEDFYVDEINED